MKATALPRHADARGYFMEIFRASEHSARFVQDGISFNRSKGTLRGLHTQVGRGAQTQLLTVLSGAILDVLVMPEGDRFEIAYNTMEAGAANQLLIPPAALHGFVTLSDDVILLYKSDRYFQPGADAKVDPFDAVLSIKWPVTSAEAIVSEADRSAQSYESFLAQLRNAR
jgi:dTDP-4-dehydrorhamnose 3,5-epimerase